jgi:hypothetical protein
MSRRSSFKVRLAGALFAPTNPVIRDDERALTIGRLTLVKGWSTILGKMKSPKFLLRGFRRPREIAPLALGKLERQVLDEA